ncbi:MAG: UvrD-helicase domain-containing protein, partial [Thioalkalispiraceae bacterium]
YESLLHNHQNVRTTTFHAFCQDLLRRFPMEADIPPGFDLVERTAYLIDEAWSNLENELTRNPQLPVSQYFDILLTRLGTSETRSLLNKFISARSEWWAISEQPGFSIESHCQRLAERLAISMDDDPLTSYFTDQENISELQKFNELIGLHVTKGNQETQLYVEQALDSGNELTSRLDNVWLAFFTKGNTVRVRNKNKTLIKSLGDKNADILLGLHETQVEKLMKLRQQLHAQETFTLTRAWLYAGSTFIDSYQQIKKNHRHLDFSDLEWQCYRLLNTSDHADWIQYKLDQRIDHLLVDEFQDTNQTQWQLLLPLLKELAAAKQERLRSVLFVGDGKQSIYRFRRAEPRLFDAASYWIEKQLGAEKKYLTCSWRSSPAIIDFVNRLFTDNREMQLNDFQQHETVKQNLSGAVELLPLSIKESSKKNEVGKFRNPLHEAVATSDSEHLLEARMAAEKINELIHSRVAIATKDEDQARPIRFGDIMILLRNRTHAADYEQALREAHIPYLGTERGTLLESLEIMDMVNLLQWLITPFNNHALAGVLRSPLFSATETDLYTLVGKPNWFDAILDQKDQFATGSPLARAALHLQNWMNLTEILPVHDLLDRIYSEGNVIRRYQANYPEHLQSRVQANLTRFIELALENDSGRYPSLTRFLAWLKLLKQQDQEAPDQPASSSDKNKVRMLTIHESKGLEAPVVLLLDATTSKRNQGGASVLIDWPMQIGDAPETDDYGNTANNSRYSHPREFLLSPAAKYPNPYCEKLLQIQTEKEQQEEANLLYVAVTRAQQYLYISGSGKSQGWYENICQQYTIDPVDITEAHTLAVHNGNTKITEPEIKPTGKPLIVDPKLSQPIKQREATIELSPSKLEYEELPAEYYQAEQQSSAGKRLAARQRGILIHQMIEALSQQSDIEFSSFCRQHQLDAQDESINHYWQQAQQCITRFPEFYQDNQFQQAYSEIPVAYVRQGVLINGVIDRLIIKDHEAIIIDYKTHQVDSEQALEEVAQLFRPQLDAYKEGITLLYPEHTIKTCIVFTSVATCIEI